MCISNIFSPVVALFGKQLFKLAQSHHAALHWCPVWDRLATEVVRYGHVLTHLSLSGLVSNRKKQDPCQAFEMHVKITEKPDLKLQDDSYFCLACSKAALLLSSSNLLLASSSCVRGLGAGLGGIAGSWMKGCEGWTWVDDEPGRAVETEEELLRSWAETHGCTAPGLSTEVGRGESVLVPVLLELLVLPLRVWRWRKK